MPSTCRASDMKCKQLILSKFCSMAVLCKALGHPKGKPTARLPKPNCAKPTHCPTLGCMPNTRAALLQQASEGHQHAKPTLPYNSSSLPCLIRKKHDIRIQKGRRCKGRPRTDLRSQFRVQAAPPITSTGIAQAIGGCRAAHIILQA